MKYLAGYPAELLAGVPTLIEQGRLAATVLQRYPEPHAVRNALGTHTTVSRVQGNRLKAKREIRIASLFKDAPAAFLKMIVVHELAHLKERDHDRAFYAPCRHMEPDYPRLEFDLRLWLTALELEGRRSA